MAYTPTKTFMVSNVNSLATVTWEDFVSGARAFRGASERQQLTAIKLIGVLYAVGIAALSLCMGAVGGVVEGSQLVTAATSGALLGVFVLAALVPRATGAGALAGMLAAHALTAALAVGRLACVSQAKAMLPLSTAGCPNATLAAGAAAPHARLVDGGGARALAPLLAALGDPHPTGPSQESAFMSALKWVFSVSYMWYAVIGTAACVAVGAAVSACAPAGVPCAPHLLHPAVRRARADKPPADKPPADKPPAADAQPDSHDGSASARTADTALEEPVTANRVFDAYETKARSQQTRF